MTRQKPPPFVFAAAVLGIATFSCMDAVMKDLVLAIGAFTTLLWRSWAGVVVSGALYAIQRPARPSREALGLHALRGAVTVVMAISFFWGLARIPMAQAVALTFIAPLLSLFLAAAMLGERITRTAAIASLIALTGVGIILIGQWQSAMGPQALRGAIAVLGSSLCYAYNIVLMRRQALVAGLRLSTDGRDGEFDGMSHSGRELSIRNTGPDCVLPALPTITLRDARGRVLLVIRRPPPGMHPGPVMMPVRLGGGHRATTDLRWVSGPVFPSNRVLRAASVTVRIGAVTLRAPLRAVLYGRAGEPVTFDQSPSRAMEGMPSG